jgi:hypothetical protein
MKIRIFVIAMVLFMVIGSVAAFAACNSLITPGRGSTPPVRCTTSNLCNNCAAAEARGRQQICDSIRQHAPGTSIETWRAIGCD